jgi:hypothetical protein
MARDLRFIIVPKVAHPWYDEVNQGARTQAGILGRELGLDLAIEYLPPAVAGVAESGGGAEFDGPGGDVDIAGAGDPLDVCRIRAACAAARVSLQDRGVGAGRREAAGRVRSTV